MDGFFSDINRALDQRLTPAVKKIFVINVAVWVVLILLNVITNLLSLGDFSWLVERLVSLTPYFAMRGCVWQFVTYMFVHIEPMHLFFNMLILWFFAPDLEVNWGTRRFWWFYMTTGVGAGLVYFIVQVARFYSNSYGNPEIFNPMLGASGALYGVMLAFAAYNPEAIVLVFGIFPIKVKYLVAIMAFLTFIDTAGGGHRNPGVANLTHLSGLVIAYIYLAQYHRDWDIRHWRWRMR